MANIATHLCLTAALRTLTRRKTQFSNKMSSGMSNILHNHLQLCQWQDQLEFLCFILCEIVDPAQNTNHDPNQNFDLLNFIDKIDKACNDTDGRLRALLNKQAISNLKTCLDHTRCIRNMAAHHVSIGTEALFAKEAVTRSAITALENIIQKAGKKYHVGQVWISDSFYAAEALNRGR